MTNFTQDNLEGNPTWDTESFENDLTTALISLYETKLVKQKKNHPSNRLDESILNRVRKLGVYLPNPNRIIPGDEFDIGYNLPDRVTFSYSSEKETNSFNDVLGYRHNVYLEKIERLPKGYKRLGGGQLFKIARMSATFTGGIDGDVHYVSVDKQGIVHNCDPVFNLPHSKFGGPTLITQMQHEPKYMEEIRLTALVALNYETDKCNAWLIDAKEDIARCIVGVDADQIKSLLYARSLPVTVTGRKRPILHLVAAHRRRMKEGIDIDISQYLRGVEKVEMNGTLFTIKPPVILDLSKK